MKKSIINTMLAGAFFCMALAACEKFQITEGSPSCMENTIKDQDNLEKVWKWEVDGKTYYYFQFGCCDYFNDLYDENCNKVCSPDGGIAGSGDGNCPEFVGEIVKTLVWEKAKDD